MSGNERSRGPGARGRNGRVLVMLLTGVGLLTGVILVVVWLTGGRDRTDSDTGPSGDAVFLPAPQTNGGMTVAEALARRRSVRDFADRRVPIEALSQLCWAAQGITDCSQGLRTAPSAGALYPLTVFVVTAEGVDEYQPAGHSLRRVRSGDVRDRLRESADSQSWVSAAPLCLVISTDVSRTAAKYGGRAERYCLLEAGHSAQNVLLQATALGLTGVPVGAFDDQQVSATLRLPPNLRPLYLLPLGYPRPAE